MKKKTSLYENGLIWFGAAVSIAEIITGTYFATLGFMKGALAIIIGHIIGCTMFFCAGVIGGKVRKSAMETVKMSFGVNGSYLFAALNILQLIGWTGIMIYDGAISANAVWCVGSYVWAMVIGVLILVWILVGVKNLGKLNTIAMFALFILTIVLSFIVFRPNNYVMVWSESMSFGAAVELSVAMPLSWLPLISDYTKDAKKPVAATAVSTVVYGIVSCWMYFIGMSLAIHTGGGDIASIMIKSGLGLAGLIIIILSTVTTTFLDVYSAGISSTAISKKFDAKWVAVAVAIIGTAGAIALNMTNITNFLYFIGSVFAPMIAIVIADFFILKEDSSNTKFNIHNLIIWLIGFVIYRIFMRLDIIIGSTLPDMLITIMICVVYNNIKCRLK